jgi:hypothetical protein
MRASPQDRRAASYPFSFAQFIAGGLLESIMKAVVYRGPHQVAVENVPDPKIERPTDAIVV